MTKKIIQFVIIIFIFLVLINFKNILKNFYPINYQETINKYAVKYELDPYLIYALIKAESKFNPYAISNKGAIGLMQITPSTGDYIAELLGDKNFSTDKLYNPDKNIKYGCYYLSKLFNDFNGDLDCVLAAYNGGEGNVRKWLKESKNGFTLEINKLPFDETKKYVKRVKQNYKIYKYIY
ncbi:soluble lytic murein transglycosylase [Caloramator quimbayensis]|uniref:Soluble lytic murein transglycosylase n=1 Tax=Caloramator quimbayensis TaxID=1147123 RepID=A0A1T4YFB1_9CLOT|nr:lytic transglycosylase domain-containing protein [Caloramator quimbayensis]SKA99915.1 soluble lytic murein transglycosylase [Caloramator quimbayensis]